MNLRQRTDSLRNPNQKWLLVHSDGETRWRFSGGAGSVLRLHRLLLVWIYAVSLSEPLNCCEEILSCCSFMYSHFQRFVQFGFGRSNDLSVSCFDQIILEWLRAVWRQLPVSCHLLISSAGYLTATLPLTCCQLVPSERTLQHWWVLFFGHFSHLFFCHK